MAGEGWEDVTTFVMGGGGGGVVNDNFKLICKDVESMVLYPLQKPVWLRYG